MNKTHYQDLAICTEIDGWHFALIGRDKALVKIEDQNGNVESFEHDGQITICPWHVCGARISLPDYPDVRKVVRDTPQCRLHFSGEYPHKRGSLSLYGSIRGNALNFHSESADLSSGVEVRAVLTHFDFMTMPYLLDGITVYRSHDNRCSVTADFGDGDLLKDSNSSVLCPAAGTAVFYTQPAFEG